MRFILMLLIGIAIAAGLYAFASKDMGSMQRNVQTQQNDMQLKVDANQQEQQRMIREIQGE